MSDFRHGDTDYNCAEKYLMAHKAELFDDTTRYQKIMASSDPAEEKAIRRAIGRAVSGFDKRMWDSSLLKIAHQTNLSKFGRNPT